MCLYLLVVGVLIFPTARVAEIWLVAWLHVLALGMDFDWPIQLRLASSSSSRVRLDTIEECSGGPRILRVCDLKTQGLFLKRAVMPLPDMVDRTEFTSGDLLQLAIVICLDVSIEKICFFYMWLVLVIVHFTWVTLLNPQCKLSCAMNQVGDRMRLCLPRLSAPFSQVLLPLEL